MQSYKMGRYKFPGKPTKHVNKKRVNVLSSPSTKSNETSIGYNEFLSTSDNSNTNCNSNKRTKTLSEFNMQDLNHGKQTDSEERNISIHEPKCNVLTSNSNMTSLVLEHKSNDCERLSVVRRTSKSNPYLYNCKNYRSKHDSTKSTRKRLMKKGSEVRIVTKVDVHDTVSKKITSCNSRRSLYRRKKQVKDKIIPSRLLERDSANIVGKFVLPSKSLHSSRVIIPNKRFLNNEQICKKNDVDCLAKNHRKPKIMDKTIIKYNNENKSKSNLGHKKEFVEDSVEVSKNTISISDTTFKESNEFSLTKEISENSKDSNDMVLIDSSGNTNVPKSCSKLILRKARLQLLTHVSEDMDGPFSSYSASSPSPPGTVTCGVCGAVRFYRFVKQARKFNIYSCESCRKFISKMIKKQTCAKNCSISTLVCHKGQGMCHVPPIVRSQQWKLLRCAYKARCPACWLKMCLQSFQMPPQLKLSLTNMLPENMRTYDDCNKLDIVPNTNKLNSIQEIQNNHTNNASQNILQDKLGKVLESSISPIKLDILSSKTDTLLKDMKNEIKFLKPRTTRVVNQKKNIIVSNQESSNTMPDCTKRQKIELKGPRVKHVCRSASIVLGQPLATFSRECNPDDRDKNNLLCEASSETDACINCTSVTEDITNNTGEEVAINKINQHKKLPHNEIDNIFLAASVDEQKNPLNSLKPIITISADYLENYDTESKIHNSGFGLIGSEPFTIKAVCFYCGSAGQEQLLYCACCCEPYHYYCIDDSVIHRYLCNNSNIFNIDGNTNTVWKCSRCSVCFDCGKTEKGKTTCQMCHRYFHPECMQPNWTNANKPTICLLCLRCEDCGSENLTKLVSNLFICLPCFKLRMRNKSCILCLTFDENSNSKMVKCGNCKNIIHAECEKISDEMYDIIHHLPASSTYTCSTCSSENKSFWKNSVNIALKNGFHIVLRLLTRNPSARNLMKSNLLKNTKCSCITDNIQNFYSENNHNIKNINAPTIFKKDSLDESQSVKSRNVNDIKRDKDNNFDISIKNIRKKFCIRECSVRIKNCLDSKKKNLSSNLKIQNKECDKSNFRKYEDKKNSIENCERNNRKSFCNKHDFMPIFLLLNIKRKIHTNIYKTVKEFHSDVQQALKKSFCHDLLNVLDTVIKDTFPWYNPQLLSHQESYTNKSPVKLNRENTKSQTDSLSTSLKENVQTAISQKYLLGNKIDTRKCVLCHTIGDGSVSLEGRLLYCGQDEWIHVNCAFWSSQVYEELDCSLQNVHEAIANSRKTLCSVCKENGATIACSFQNCSDSFHYMCARIKSCTFLTNKTVFCSSHYSPLINNSGTAHPDDFQLQRSIYIYIDMKNSKYVELSKVQCLIGCLNVTNLGTFFPSLSDTEEAIIPSEFVCSRLFWSTTEPWKIVRYSIKTSILIPSLKNLDEAENNFTVDHSQSRNINQKVMEISKRLDYGKYKNKLNSKDYDKESINITDDDKIVFQVLENLLELICNKEMEESCDDEPQSTADILPPELKDAIFEDLPHDLLDGISVQDIFPKLMSYEDIITADLKMTDSIDSDSSLKSHSGNDLSNSDIQFKSRKTDLLFAGSDVWLEPKYSIRSFEDYSHSGKDTEQNLKRSKSEIFTGIKKITKSCNHQRSCSLTWSCKLDNSRPPSNKKRKLSCTPKSVTDISNNLFMLVDGSKEKNCMLQELRLPDSVLMSVGHSTNVDCLTDSVRELKYCLEENQEIEHEKENNCRVWRSNKSQSRIIQLDGANDTSSSSDSESYNENNSLLKSVTLNKSNDEPVKCTRCDCTYRTLNSYKKHLTICDYISSSESDSENEEHFTNLERNQVVLEHNTIKTPVGNIYETLETSAASETSVSTTCRLENNKNNTVTQDVNIKTINSDSNSCLQSVYAPTNDSENKGTDLHKTGFKQNIQTSVQVNYMMNNSEILTSTVSGTQKNNEITYVENNQQKIPITKLTSVKKVIKQRNNVKTRTTSVLGRNRKSQIKRTRTDKTVDTTNYIAPSVIHTNRAIKLPEVQNNAVGPTIIIQHLSSPNLMPAYIEAFQHQTGQNLQCVATIVPNEYKSPSFVAPSSFIPGGFQIQTTESSNVINIPTDGFSVVPSLDSLSQSRPVLGTLIQQNRPATNFQCEMLSTEQLILGSVPAVEPVINDVHNSLYFSSPVYYGFEAVVQNTVLSSQQFVSTLPGVLSSNSSYSTTTTQVIQSSKLEPIIDMNGTSYIVVNSNVPQVSPPITVNSHPFLTSFHGKHSNVLTSSHPHPSLMESPSPTAYPFQIVPLNDSFVPVVKSVIIEQIQPPIEQEVPCIKAIVTSTISKDTHVNKPLIPAEISATSTINVPLCDSENKIPMNVVTPTPQVTSSSQVLKPTNRVLPMQSQPPKLQPINNKVRAVEPPNILNKLSQTVDKIQETLQNDAKSLQSFKYNSNKSPLLKLESASLKLVFQKQSEDGIYKISNKYISKKKVPIEVATIKKTKIQTVENDLNIESNGELVENQNLNKNMLVEEEKSPNILYTIQSQDGYDYSSTSLTELWKKVFDAVQEARAAHKMPLLSEDALNVISGLQLLGLNSNGLRYLIEQLPGVGNCIKYKPILHKQFNFPDSEESNEDHSFRAARCEPYMFVKQPYDMFSWLASEHRNPDYIHQIDNDYACRRSSSVNLPMAMRFRQLKETSKQTVGVYRSRIHGRGLFCLSDIECGEMVIEYAGEVIRSTLTDKREKYYNSKGIGCYMFRVDDNFVIDATMKGNAARFINHSCDPNCYSRVLEILGHKHILIFALRKIIQGEELTYDYKFPFEEDKIPCTCGAKRCRKYLN